MEFKQLIRSIKPELISVLCTDASFVLQHVQKKQLITDREYRNLNQSSMFNGEKVTTDMLDKIMSKSDQHCKDFISLLEEEEIVKNFPALEELLRSPKASQQVAAHAAVPGTPVQEAGLDKTYEMTHSPRGHCLIINNVNFKKSNERRGSDEDAGTLEEVFSWLGFTVERRRNLTVAEMKALLQECGQSAGGDCFACCVLSHGKPEGILGHDDDVTGNVLPIEEILSPFKGNVCRGLAGKPKLFFIQACRGTRFQDEASIATDTAGKDKQEPDVDVRPLQITIPADADFLISMATVNEHYSVRHPTEGSWFIQSLCRQLREGVPRGDDILTIITRVNDDVCQEEGFIRGKKAKQVPDQSFRLRKKLVFPMFNS